MPFTIGGQSVLLQHTRAPPLIYTPLPNSRQLNNTAFRYVRSVQFGAYMWRNGLNRVKMDSKWDLIVQPKWCTINFGKMHF